ncbi:MAG: IS982 family transposase [Methylobacter sp.]|nr:IS982 family transposase [Methylobacter sp.]MDP2429935.1 IS982 family transposase [Methylobacter sp.]MDP3056318.1 IS982 family transposase [Methylobacter sp.]MDP3362865.1 IS982 family transposase [Methylobacter sp.]
MNWQEQLITIYLYICKHYQNNLWVYSQRMSNYADLSFTDEEVIAIYLFGVIDKNRELKKIYGYADRHLRPWFPRLPSYTAFVQRLNKVADVFAPLLDIIQQEQEEKNQGQVWLMDSFPVALAKQGHRFKAHVARELADAGYCSTKKLYYYGVRVHIVGRRQAGTLPNPEYIGVTGASCHDGTVFDQIRPELTHNELYGDKAYHRSDAKDVRETQNLTVLTPVKKQKGQRYLEPQDQWLSTAVSRIRQPIETLFGWIEQQTGIECAGKVRSYSGLMVHVFGKLAAALFFWNYLRVSS